MARALQSLQGQHFDRWRVIARAPNEVNGRTAWVCRCTCGVERVVQGNNLRSGASKSCGCWNSEAAKANATHGHRRVGQTDGTYSSWAAMTARCTNPKSKSWQYYGGRGIAVCKRWRSFQNFLRDMGERPTGMTIERKNVDRGYTPKNCVWLPRNLQSRNRRSTKGLQHVYDPRR
jgi:hypothetical protein